jgi:hypothetical protein
MTTDPDQIRAQIHALLADLPEIVAQLDVAGPAAPGLDVAGPAAPGLDVAGPAAPGLNVADTDTVAARLEEAHELLVQALESVERG